MPLKITNAVASEENLCQKEEAQEIESNTKSEILNHERTLCQLTSMLQVEDT